MEKKFDIAAFTHTGTVRDKNQDAVLVNGMILTDGEMHFSGQESCCCFVADGVGGNKGGDFASKYILTKINAVESQSDIKLKLHEANTQFLEEIKGKEDLAGAATTITGLMVSGNLFQVIHAGDSQLWLFRGDLLFKVTNDQVLDESSDNSPITSYFGGFADNLHFDPDITVTDSQPDDLFIICSDGLLKSLTLKEIKSHLKSPEKLVEKSGKILAACLQKGADDNTSAVLIHQTI